MAILTMQRIIALIILVFISVESIGQEHPSFVGISAGASFPVGKFSRNDLDDGCFALPGLAVSAEGAWFFKPWIGAGGYAGIDLFPVDVVALAEEKTKSDPYINSTVVRSDPFFTTSLYGGFFFRVPLKGALSFTGKALGGVFYAQTPYQLYKISYYLIGRTYTEKTSAYDFSPSFLAGAGFRYDFNDYLGLEINSDFTYNKCGFEFYKPDGTISTDQKLISSVTITAGLVIKL
jgi:hypothetical protein